MSLAIYKPGQGYWTRVLTAVGAAIMVLSGVAWLWRQLGVVRSEYLIYIQTGIAVALIVGAGLGLLWVFNKPRVVDFMIATEAEMRKVNWPTRRELTVSTWVVICGTLLMATVLQLFDLILWVAGTKSGIIQGVKLF
ncbi:MAG: preprotein translocase subunit SecE [Planctomycetota bacterium]|nr:preprotein translocase subunit SecE [Planctomycetota bacterium]